MAAANSLYQQLGVQRIRNDLERDLLVSPFSNLALQSREDKKHVKYQQRLIRMYLRTNIIGLGKGFRFVCCQAGCGITMTNKENVRRHWASKHPGAVYDSANIFCVSDKYWLIDTDLMATRTCIDSMSFIRILFPAATQTELDHFERFESSYTINGRERWLA